MTPTSTPTAERSRPDYAAEADADLLARYIDDRDEFAFAAIVRRHGGMVYGVGRRLLRSDQDAEDAAQVTFLVLARKAGSVEPRAELANWLCGVAVRTARGLRRANARRLRNQERLTQAARDARPPADDAADDVRVEVARLPEVYRRPVVLCDIEGRDRPGAAAELRVSEAALASRLSVGRRLLAVRLRRRWAALVALVFLLAPRRPARAAAPPAVDPAGPPAGLPRAGWVRRRPVVTGVAAAIVLAVIALLAALELLEAPTFVEPVRRPAAEVADARPNSTGAAMTVPVRFDQKVPLGLRAVPLHADRHLTPDDQRYVVHLDYALFRADRAGGLTVDLKTFILPLGGADVEVTVEVLDAAGGRVAAAAARERVPPAPAPEAKLPKVFTFRLEPRPGATFGPADSVSVTVRSTDPTRPPGRGR